MRFKLTIILVILNVIAGYYIYRLEKQNKIGDEFGEESGKVFQEIFDISQLTIKVNTEKSKDVFELERNRNQWLVKKPIQWPANKHAVEQIIHQLQSLEKEISFSLEDITRQDQTLADYGLDQPSLSLTFSSPKTDPQTLHIGAPTEMGSRVYVLHPNGEEIIVIGDALLRSLSISLNELRSQKVFHIPAFEVTSLVLQIDEQRTRIEKEKEAWNFVTPVSAKANAILVNSTLNQLVDTQAILLYTTGDDDLEKLGLTSPEMRVTLGGNNRRQTISIGNVVEFEQEENNEDTPEMRYAVLDDNPTVFTVLAEPFSKLKQAQEILRERRFFFFNPLQVSDITIAQPPRLLKLQKLENQDETSVENTWQVLTQHEGGEVISQPSDEGIVNALLVNLSRMQAQRFVSDSPSPSDLTEYGFDEPNATITIQLEDGTSKTLLLGNLSQRSDSNPTTNSNNLFAKLDHEEFVYEVRSQFLAIANTNPLHYRERTLETHPNAARIKSLKLTNLETGNILFEKTINPESETWPLALESIEDEKEREALLTIVDMLRNNFQVKNFIEDEFLELPNLPWQYRMDVEVSLPGGQENQIVSRTFFFTKRLSGNEQIGGSPELKFTFTLTQSLVDALFPLTFVKEVPALPETPEEVENAELTAE